MYVNGFLFAEKRTIRIYYFNMKNLFWGFWFSPFFKVLTAKTFDFGRLMYYYGGGLLRRIQVRVTPEGEDVEEIFERGVFGEL